MTNLRLVIGAAALMASWVAMPVALAAQSADDQSTPAAPSANLMLRAFGAVEWGASEREPNSFALGQFALFATSNLSERISVLAEIVMEGGIDTRVVTDLERLQLTFRWNDHLQASAGRYHTGIGFYNTAFHHGAYFETPIGRPRVFAFEDEGGVLPVHDVGVTVRGQVPKAPHGLLYLVEIGNGRDWDQSADAPGSAADEVARDQNAAKATNVGLSYRPERWLGLEFGTSFYRDVIPRTGAPSVPLRIGAAYVTYRTPAVEVLAEWLVLSHRTADRRHTDAAGYAQASKAWGRFRPYYRYDRLAIEPDTPFIGAIGASTAHTVGVRVDPSDWVGLKAQYERADVAGQRGVDALRTQLVFVF